MDFYQNPVRKYLHLIVDLMGKFPRNARKFTSIINYSLFISEAASLFIKTSSFGK